MSQCEYCGTIIKDKDDDGHCDHCGGPIPEKPEPPGVMDVEEIEPYVAGPAYTKVSQEDMDLRKEDIDRSIKKVFKFLIVLGPIFIIVFAMPFITPVFDDMQIPTYVNVIGYTRCGETGDPVSAYIQVYYKNEFMEAWQSSSNGRFDLGHMYQPGATITIIGECLENYDLGPWLPFEATFVIPWGESGDTVSIGTLYFYHNTTVI